jgi:hypothetical protein
MTIAESPTVFAIGVASSGTTNMMRQCTTMDGDIRTRLTTKKLAGLLSKAGFTAHVKRWDHDRGNYIHVLGEVDDFTLSRIGANGYHVNALCISGQRMQSLASRMSQVLTALKIRHRFHVNSGRFRRAGYFHHRWPEEHAIQSLKLYRSE